MDILIIGVNTRPVVNSAKKLGHNVYSVSYYNPIDLYADEKKYLINDKYHGIFRKNYNENDLLNLASYYVDDVDYIFVGSGVFENENSKIPNWNVVGNSPKKIKRISNKYYTTKKLANLGYNIPTTYIANNSTQLEKYLYDLKSAVIKPKYGSGGFGICSLDLESIESNYTYNTINNNTHHIRYNGKIETNKNSGKNNINNINNKNNIACNTNYHNNKNKFNNTNIDTIFDYLKDLKYPVIVQEMIKSDSYSASFINSNFICFNKQIILNNMYVGNITPYIPKPLEKNLKKVIDSFKEVIESFDLEGMNGIDFMIKEDIPVILEINPRILGTFETIEFSSKTSLVKSILENKPVYPKTKYIKKILFAGQKLRSNIKKQQNIFDIPQYGAIIEKDEPLTTLIGRSCGEINNTIDGISKMVIKYEDK